MKPLLIAAVIDRVSMGTVDYNAPQAETPSSEAYDLLWIQTLDSAGISSRSVAIQFETPASSLCLSTLAAKSKVVEL